MSISHISNVAQIFCMYFLSVVLRVEVGNLAHIQANFDINTERTNEIYGRNAPVRKNPPSGLVGREPAEKRLTSSHVAYISHIM